MSAPGHYRYSGSEHNVAATSRLNLSLRYFTMMVALTTMMLGAYVAFVFSADTHRVGAGSGVSVAFFEAPGNEISLANVRQAVDSRTARKISVFERDASRPLVMEITPPADSAIHRHEQAVEVRLVRGTKQRAWIVPMTPLARGADGASQAIDVSESMKRISSGTAFSIPAQAAPYRILVAMETSALWKPKVFLWPRESFARLNSAFDRFGGALMGVFIGLAAFSGVVAALNRQPTFMLFSAWLFTSLRMAIFNGGWDLPWIGIHLDEATTLLSMQITLAIHGVLSCGLFLAMFSRALDGSKLKTVTKTLLVVFLGLSVSAPWIPYPMFMLGFYIAAAPTVLMFVFGSAYMLIKKPTATAGWYLFSYTVWMLGVLGEMAYQAGMLHGLADSLNIQTSSILAALIMGVALAEQMRKHKTMRQKAQLGEMAALQRIELNYQNTPVALFSLNADLSMRMNNRAFRELFRLADKGGVSSVSLQRLLGEEAFGKLAAELDGQDELSTQVCSSRPFEPMRWYTVELSRQQGHFEGSVEDVTARKAAEDKLLHLVDHDALTGALNRRGYEAALQNALHARQASQALVLADISIERFTHLSTLYGSAVMDRIFLELYQLIDQGFERTQIARVDDSFRLIMANTEANQVFPKLVNFVEGVNKSALVPNRPAVSIRLRIGLLEVTRQLELDQAQNYLSQASTMARHDEYCPVVLISDEDQALAQSFESIKAFDRIDSITLDETFFLVMQPIVPIDDASKKLKFEMLLRMRSESGGLIRPDKFIPAAEEAGIMNRIDRWVLETSLNLLDEHPRLCEEIDLITVNLSGSSLNDPIFVDELMQTLRKRAHLASKLCLEITESVALNDIERTRTILESMQLLGVKVALDDFGSGYTGWGYLQHLPADILKLDGSIIRDCLSRSVDRLIIKSAVELAGELGMKCVAEMAETQETVVLLQALGVDYIQGYYFSKPLEVAEVISHERDLKQLLLSRVPGLPESQATPTTSVAAKAHIADA